MKRNLFNKIVLFSVILFLLLVAPHEISLPNQANVRAICTGLAVDTSQKNAEDIMVTAQILIPKAGGQYTQSMTLVTGEGKDLMQALNQLEFFVGKKIRLAHCFFIILGEEASQNNMAETLDYLIRGNNTANNIMLLLSKGLAKDLISVASNTNANDIDNIQTLLKYNDKYLAPKEANLKLFFSDYLSPHRTSFMSCLSTFPADDSGESGTSGGSSGSSGNSGSSSGGNSSTNNSSQSTTKDKIKNDGSVAVFLDGKLATILSTDERKYFNWLDKNVAESVVELNNITDDTFKNATIGYTITHKDMDTKFDFVNGKPCIFIDYNLKLRAEMFSQADGSKLPNKTLINDTINQAFNTKVQDEVNKAMQIQKQYGFDAFNYYKSFNIADHAKWQDYLSSLENPKNYIQGIEVFTRVKCNSQI